MLHLSGLGQRVRAARTGRRCRVSRNVSDVAESVDNPTRLKEMPVLGATYNPVRRQNLAAPR